MLAVASIEEPSIQGSRSMKNHFTDVPPSEQRGQNVSAFTTALNAAASREAGTSGLPQQRPELERMEIALRGGVYISKH
jgi:hypothetical protein